MPRVAFDTQICIWGIKKIASSGQAIQVGLTDQLIKSLTRHSVDIMLPAPVVSELISPMPPHVALPFVSMLEKKFRIGYFDSKATVILGEILNHHYTNGKYQTLGITKTAMKYDAYIIAIAVATGAECIYSEDNDFTKIAAHFIPILPLTKLPPSIVKSGGLIP